MNQASLHISPKARSDSREGVKMGGFPLGHGILTVEHDGNLGYLDSLTKHLGSRWGGGI